MSNTLPDRQITMEELRYCDGKEGRPCWVAFEGIVYDLSESALWPNGRHVMKHYAGADLSGQMTYAPHRPDILQRFSAIGRVASQEKEETT